MGRSLFSILFERMSKYNLIRGEAFVSGECVSVIEDSGFTNVELVIAKVLMSMHDDVPTHRGSLSPCVLIFTSRRLN